MVSNYWSHKLPLTVCLIKKDSYNKLYQWSKLPKSCTRKIFRDKKMIKINGR